MRHSIPLFLTVFAFSLSAQAKIPVLSGKQYGTAKSAAAGGAAYSITRALGSRKIISTHGIVRARGVKVTTPGQGNRFNIETLKKNPDNGKPLARTSVDVVRSLRGKFHFLHPGTGSVTLNLPMATAFKSMSKAAKATVSKAFLRDSNVKEWFADYGLHGADVMREFKTELVNKSQSGKTAQLRVFHRGNGQDGSPFLEATVKVRRQANGSWQGLQRSVSNMFVNDLWE